jgi:hypothetical protein
MVCDVALKLASVAGEFASMSCSSPAQTVLGFASPTLRRLAVTGEQAATSTEEQRARGF